MPSERNFRMRNVGIGEILFCDKCDREMLHGERCFIRRDKWEYDTSKYVFDTFSHPKKIIERTVLCENCVPKDEVIKEHRRMLGWEE